MESRLGVRLLQRTTRTVTPTLDGEAYYRRCLAILADVEDAEGTFRGAQPQGLLRVDVQGTLARHFLMPSLPDFFARHPGIELTMVWAGEAVDLIRAVQPAATLVSDIGAQAEECLARAAGLCGRRSF